MTALLPCHWMGLLQAEEVTQMLYLRGVSPMKAKDWAGANLEVRYHDLWGPERKDKGGMHNYPLLSYLLFPCLSGLDNSEDRRPTDKRALAKSEG